jgi:acyl-coenzyme A thioesterase PaaI-like protein
MEHHGQRSLRMSMNSTDIPEGFEPHFRKSPFTDPWEPLYSKRTYKAVIIGLRLAKPHTNARGNVHGGLISALADNAMGDVIKTGRTICFAQSLITADDSVIARANATFRVAPKHEGDTHPR